MNEATHLDIFSGLGGFAVAAKEAGFRTIAFCEIDERCRTFLERTWRLPVEGDIRKLDARKYAGVSLLTGGPPCQPSSRAGKQRGAEDDRWLWPEALRVLEESRPDSVIFENPLGIIDMGLDGILSEMERCGYEVQAFNIPACAVDSPQLRHRIWIVGFMADARRERSGKDEQRRRQDQRAVTGRSSSSVASADSDRRNASESGDARSEEKSRGEYRNEPDRRNAGDVANATREGRRQIPAIGPRGTRSAWSESVWMPCADGKARRAPNNSFDVVNGLHRSILAALGNSIVPQVALEIMKAIFPLL